MDLSKTNLLIASDGEKTYAVLNGVPIICDELSFFADGIDVQTSIKNARLSRTFTEEQFLDFVENKLGYKLSAKG